MNEIKNTIGQLHRVDAAARQNTILSGIHPVGMLLVTVLYLSALLSFLPQNLTGLLGMAVYPVILYQLGGIPLKEAFRHIWGLMLLLFLVGIANPILDREILTYWGSLPVSSGMLSFFSIFLKGAFALLASYGLMASIGMNHLCYALQCLHMPKILIVVMMLTYRYLMLFLREAERRSLAYSLRAPGQRGIHFWAWGSLLGGMLLGSIDRAEKIYYAMQLRGFQGEFWLGYRRYSGRKTVVFCLLMSCLILIFRAVPVFEQVGGWLVNLQP
ncbi:MAG: energy-coupling factor transporter transmembrane protein EcfT [Lachnospiraceae bacterium]|nr:energy-coupling factor transporter transmembrane protein EcfT [Lachnospiraceae bacterium]